MLSTSGQAMTGWGDVLIRAPAGRAAKFLDVKLGQYPGWRVSIIVLLPASIKRIRRYAPPRGPGCIMILNCCQTLNRHGTSQEPMPWARTHSEVVSVAAASCARQGPPAVRP